MTQEERITQILESTRKIPMPGADKMFYTRLVNRISSNKRVESEKIEWWKRLFSKRMSH